MTWNFRTVRWLQSTASLTAALGCLLATSHASAEVTVAKGDTWDAYVAGRVSAFLSYNVGDGYPVPLQPGGAPCPAGAMCSIQPGGGVDTAAKPLDTKTEVDAAGMPDPTKQGKISKMRVRSGYYPNIITIGAHKHFVDQLRMTAQVSIWGTIESSDRGPGKAELQPANGIRDNGVNADFREGYLQLEGSRWGSFTGGRFMSIVGRGLTEIDALYGHGYGVGFPMVSRAFNLPPVGDLTYPGPTGGMTGFGVLSATYSGGVMYTTPSFAGVKAALGVFDGSTYVLAGWGANRVVRPELELAYDLHTGNVGVHLFGSGGFQKLNAGGSRYSESVWAATYGGRLEIGPIHLGVGGFMGKGAGLDYAFDDSPALSSTSSMRSVTTRDAMGMSTTVMEKDFKIRNTRGFVGMLQVALGPVDLNVGAGQTQVLQLDADKAAAGVLMGGVLVSSVSTLKSQTGISAAVVYHVNESLHLDVDFINGAYKWYNGESQKLNVVNAGATLTF